MEHPKFKFKGELGNFKKILCQRASTIITFSFQLLFLLAWETLPKNLLSYLEAIEEYGEKNGLWDIRNTTEKLWGYSEIQGHLNI